MANDAKSGGIQEMTARAVLEAHTPRVDLLVVTPFDIFPLTLVPGMRVIVQNETPWDIQVVRGAMTLWFAAGPDWASRVVLSDEIARVRPNEG